VSRSAHAAAVLIVDDHPTFDRFDSLTLIGGQVLLDPLAERQRRRPAAGQEPGQLALKRPLRVSPGAEPAYLKPLRTAACDAIAKGADGERLWAYRFFSLNTCPGRITVTSSIADRPEESQPRVRPSTTSLTERWHTPRRVEQGGARLVTLSESFE
jgi:hypothetical protein